MMPDYSRYGVYYLPEPGPLSDFGAAWLGWDVQSGKDVTTLPVPGLTEVTATPRKYGFHATLKPPFRLAPGQSPEALRQAIATLATTRPAAECNALEPARLGHFLALRPVGAEDDINALAAACVTELDPFRAPPSDAELARRRKSGLSKRQEALLLEWGYPHVLDQFRFHMTLTGRLDEGQLSKAHNAARTHLPRLPAPYALTSISLVGERPDGYFELIERFSLGSET
jgi:putative phosphonate metabolism protein